MSLRLPYTTVILNHFATNFATKFRHKIFPQNFSTKNSTFYTIFRGRMVKVYILAQNKVLTFS